MQKAGVADESTTLEIIGDLCRALVTAHANGMVHRDIKPENILLEDTQGLPRPALKLTDFGLARHINQSESLKLTQTGAMLGTPYYMSPEQFTGKYEVSPATDVYSIGITFFELLTGKLPFATKDAIQLATAHCFEEPVDVRKISPLVSDATANLVQRMLAKHPGQRPPDSSNVLEEILRLQSGEASQFLVHPVVPDHNTAKIVSVDFEWKLVSSPASIWPYVSNTDRFNKAAGLNPVNYEMVTEPDGRIRKFAQFKLAGMTIRWEEHPFEWVEGLRFSILREFSTGPFVWFVSDVELVPRSDGGTTLKQHVKIQPRGFVGRMIAKRELGTKCLRKFTDIYQRIDNTVSRKISTSIAPDHFQKVPGLKRIQRQRLEQRLDELARKNVSTEIIELIRELALNAAEQDLARLRPYAIAHRFGHPELEVVEAFLQAVPIGLLTLHWDIICPTCRLASGTKTTLREIEQHGNCSACQTKFDIDFGSSLELIFRVHPEIRVSDSKNYCAGGPGNFPHVVAQVRLQPNERLQIPISLEAGSYVARGPRLPYAIPIDVDARIGVRHARISFVPGLNRSPVAMLRAGHQNLVLENEFSSEQVIRIERTLLRSEALMASLVTTMPLFQALFPDETLSPGMLVEIATVNFLAIKMDGLDEAFRLQGDAKTYSLVQDFWRIVERQILQRGGSVIERTTSAFLASFIDPVIAIETARQITAALTAEKPEWRWSVSGALHRGPALVIGDRHEVKYFGATITQTLKLALEATTNQLLLTQEISNEHGVAAALVDDLQQTTIEKLPGNNVHCVRLT